MIFQNDVVVAASGTHREANHVIGVDLADGFNADVDIIGLESGELASGVRKVVEGDRLRLFLRGTDAFSRLGEVYFEGLDLRRAVPGSISKGEAGTGGKFYRMDSSEPCGI